MNGTITQTQKKKSDTIYVYTPRLWTKDLHESDKRWRVIVAHRRSGKTTASLNHLIRDATLTEKSRWAYIAPTYKQAKNVAWDMLKEYASKFKGTKFNEGELRCDFANGSRITLYGADNPDSLRGLGLWGVIFDEYSQQPSNIFTEIIRPALADHRGYAIWIGTPKGKNDFFRLYERAKQDPKWLGILLSVDDTKLISQEELDDAEGIMDPDEFQQEWYCSFEAAIKGAYYSKEMSLARQEGRVCAVTHDKKYKVNTAWDIGVGDSMAIWFWQMTGTDVRMINYMQGEGRGLVDYIGKLQELRDKEGYIYGIHLAPHDVEHPEMSTGKTLKEVASSLGLHFEVVPKLPVEHGIDTVRRMFNKCWFDSERCAIGIDALAQYHKEWDDKRGEFKNKPFNDWSCHGADAFRYLALGRREGELSGQIDHDWSHDPEIDEFRKIRAFRKKEHNPFDPFE